MKQFKLILLSVLALTLGFSSRADERPISYDQLPQAAKAFLAQHFPDRTPLLVQADWEDYEVIYDNGATGRKSTAGCPQSPMFSSPNRSRPR